MALTVLAVAEQTRMGQQVLELGRLGRESLGMKAGIVAGYLFEPDAADGRHRRAEIGLQYLFAHAHCLEDLGTAIGADGTDAHLRHHLVESLADGLDVVLLGRLVVHLHLAVFHQVIEHGEGHVGVDGTGTVAQQQGGVHDFAYFAALDH